MSKKDGTYKRRVYVFEDPTALMDVRLEEHEDTMSHLIKGDVNLLIN